MGCDGYDFKPITANVGQFPLFSLFFTILYIYILFVISVYSCDGLYKRI